MSWTKIRYGMVAIGTLIVLGYHCFIGMQVVGGPAQAKSEPSMQPANSSQIYVVTKVIGITEAGADASTMEQTLFDDLEKVFSKPGEKERVRRSYQKYEDTRPCKGCDIVAIKEPQQRRVYELHVICPMRPKKETSGALKDIPCDQNLTRNLCRKLVLQRSVKAITVHDSIIHGRKQ